MLRNLRTQVVIQEFPRCAMQNQLNNVVPKIQFESVKCLWHREIQTARFVMSIQFLEHPHTVINEIPKGTCSPARAGVVPLEPWHVCVQICAKGMVGLGCLICLELETKHIAQARGQIGELRVQASDGTCGYERVGLEKPIQTLF